MENSQCDPGWSMAGRYGKEMKNRKLWLQERRNEEDCGSQVFFPWEGNARSKNKARRSKRQEVLSIKLVV